MRRTSKPRMIKDGVVNWEAFRDNHPTLSFTFRNRELSTEEGLDKYQVSNALDSGDLPGVCMLTYDDFKVSMVPPLEPRRETDIGDPNYGELHCVTDRPNDAQCEAMAKLAIIHKNVIRELVKRRKRKDRL